VPKESRTGTLLFRSVENGLSFLIDGSASVASRSGTATAAYPQLTTGRPV
jgi:hypothetical protein